VDGPDVLPAPLAEPVGALESGRAAEPGSNRQAALALPLQARGRTLGVLAVARPSAKCYTPEERALAEDLAGRGAIALDNARLYQNIQEGDRRKNDFLAMLAHDAQSLRRFATRRKCCDGCRSSTRTWTWPAT
jgi:GAF domain-containing protein